MTVDDQLDLLMSQMKRLHTALASLQRDVRPKNRELFDLMAEGPIEHLRRLRAEADALTGVTAAEQDEPELWLHIEGEQVAWPDAPTSILTALLDALRKGVQAGGEHLAHGALSSRPTSAIKDACDFRVVGLQTGSLRVGVRLPDAEDSRGGDRETHSKAVDAFRTYLDVAAWVGSDEPSEALTYRVPDVALRTLLLNQVKRLAPRPRGGVRLVALEGRAISHDGRVSLDRGVHSRIDAAIEAATPEAERETYTGDLREIDLDEKTFVLRNIVGDEEKSLDCQFGDELLDTAKEALDRRVEVRAVKPTKSAMRGRGGKVKVLRLVILEDASEPDGEGRPTEDKA